MTKRSEDAQREREALALRSVRNLVEEIEAEDRDRNARALKSLLWIGPLIFIGLAVIAFLLSSGKPAPTGPIISQDAFNESRASYLAAPRKKFVGATMEPRFQAYVDNCLAKIARVANSSYRTAGVSGQAQLAIAVRFDGIIEGVVADKSSGHEAMEPTIKRLVMMAQTCGAFPEEIRKDTDVLVIVQTFTLVDGATASQP